MHSVEELKIDFDVTGTYRKALNVSPRKVDPPKKTLVLSINLSKVEINLLQAPTFTHCRLSRAANRHTRIHIQINTNAHSYKP